MVRAMALPAAQLVRLLKSKTGDVDVYVYALGKALGYSTANLQWIVKQCNLETAYQTSNGITARNNAFGMSEVNVRPHTQIGAERVSPNEVQGVYSSRWSSVVDRFLWDSYWGMDSLRKSPEYPARVSEIYHASGAYRDNVVATGAPNWNLSRALVWLSVPLEILAIQTIWKSLKN